MTKNIEQILKNNTLVANSVLLPEAFKVDVLFVRRVLRHLEVFPAEH